jgi:hypothetical protein
MEADIAEIDALTSELLDYARLERGAPEIRQQTVPAAPWLEDVLADSRNGRGAGTPQLEIRALVEVDSVRCEPRYMARALVNLLRNARAHARSKVSVSLRQVGARTEIHVEDDGRGSRVPTASAFSSRSPAWMTAAHGIPAASAWAGHRAPGRPLARRRRDHFRLAARRGLRLDHLVAAPPPDSGGGLTPNRRHSPRVVVRRRCCEIKTT